MSFSVVKGTPFVSSNSATEHFVDFPTSSIGDVVFMLVMGGVLNADITSHSFVAVNSVNTSNTRTHRVFARVVDGSEDAQMRLYADNNSFNVIVLPIIITGASSDLARIELNTTLGNGFENPKFNPPSLTPSEGEANYLWVSTVASNVAGGFLSGPAGYELMTGDVDSVGSTFSAALAYLDLVAATEDPGPFSAATESSSYTATFAIPVAVSTTPTLRKGTQFTVETTLSGNITGATLAGQAITVDSKVGATVTLTDSDGTITTSGEYPLVLTDDSVDPDETIVVQVNVVGVAPANNPMRKDGAALANLTDVEVRISAGATLAGTQLFYTGTATTDANGNLGNIDLSDTAADPDDVVLLKIRTAAGDSIIAAETVGLI